MNAQGTAIAMPLALLLASSAWAQTGPNPALVHYDGSTAEPLRESVVGGEIVTRVNFNTLARTVSIRCSMETTPGSWASLLEDGHTFSVDYWPTAVAKVDERTLFVAGQAYGGTDTIVEIWRFLAPRYYPAGLKPGGQQTAARIVQGARDAVDRIYSNGTPGKMLVQGAMRLRGAASSTVLVQFHDSRDIYAMDASNGQMQLAASVFPGGPFSDARLGDVDWRIYWSRKHTTDGFVYVLRPNASDFHAFDSSSDLFTLLLFDRDMDGAIEDSLGLTANQWGQAGYSDPSSWSELD